MKRKTCLGQLETRAACLDFGTLQKVTTLLQTGHLGFQSLWKVTTLLEHPRAIFLPSLDTSNAEVLEKYKNVLANQRPGCQC